MLIPIRFMLLVSSARSLIVDRMLTCRVAVALKCDNNDDSPSQYGQGEDSSPSEYGQPAQPAQPAQPTQPSSDGNNGNGDDSSATRKSRGHLWSWFSSWFKVTSGPTSAR
jgi:hypothetical protein